ncbi:MAG: hypothetical protein PHY74_01025 [Candidatus Bathyarchaeota archaeon]|nr:hypothetical protein [Candidatus Bathyarchaeota archaeon]
MEKNVIILLSIILFSIILIIGVLLYLNNNLSEPNAESTINVTITSFNYTGSSNPVGVVWNDMFLLTYVNNEAIDVYNTTISFCTNSTFEMSRSIGVFDSTPPHYYIGDFLMGEKYSLGLIKANETSEFHGCIWNSLGDTSKVHGAAFIVTLESNGTLLDQETIYLQGSQNPADVTCTYHKTSLEVVGEDTKVVLLVAANYNRGNQVTIRYDDFYLSPYYTKNDAYNTPLSGNKTAPFETGAITIDSNNRNSTFQLTFQFPTNHNGYPITNYPLVYPGSSENPKIIEVIHEDLLDKE